MDRRVGLLALLFLLVASTHAHITDLMYSCSGAVDERCRFTQQDYTTFHSTAYKARLLHLLSSGIPAVFWSEIGSGANFTTDVSLPCIASLESWKGRMLAGQVDALAMMDAGGKFPTASMRKTTAALGDYDQCLAIRSAQYCALELFPKQVKRSLWDSGFYSLDQKVMNQDTGLVQGICLPANDCSPAEIKSLVHQIIAPYLLTAEPGFITCDTRESISWTSTLASFSRVQWACLAYVLLMVLAVGVSTGVHAYYAVTGGEPSHSANLLLTLSAFDSADKIFYVKESYFSDPRRILLDLFKAFSVTFTAVSHSYAVLGAPLGFYLFDSLDTFCSFMQQPLGLTITNEAGIGVFMVLSGFTAFQLMWPMAKAGRLPFSLALLDRLIKFLPAMAAIVSIELIWPILGSGPLYSRVSDFTVKRCTNHGWANLLFLNNWVESIDMCAPQTFFAALVIQLFLLSLIVTKVLLMDEKKGTRLCCLLIICSGVWMSVNAWRYNVTPTLFNHYPKAQDIVDHVTAVHTHFSSSCFAYFTGFLVGYCVLERGITIDVQDWRQKGRWIFCMIMLGNIPNGLLFANAAGLVDRRFSPIFILVNRGCMIAQAAIFLLFVYSVSDFSLFQHITGTRTSPHKEGDASPVVSKKFSLLAAFHRLALGIFFTNMTLVHYEIFTRRRLITLDVVSVFSRSLFTLVSVLISSFFFTIVFIHPVERLVSLIKPSKQQKQL